MGAVDFFKANLGVQAGISSGITAGTQKPGAVSVTREPPAEL